MSDPGRRAAKVDENQPGLIKAARRLGLGVATIKQPVDLVIEVMGYNVMVEVKNPRRDRSARRLTPIQVEFFGLWVGLATVIETQEDVIELANLRRDLPHTRVAEWCNQRMTRYIQDVYEGVKPWE